jgi:hypothetical protein
MPRRTYAKDAGGGVKAKPFDSAGGWLRSLADKIGSRPWFYNVGKPGELFDWQDHQNELYEKRRRRRFERKKERQKRLKEERSQRKRRNWWKERRTGGDA